MSATTEKPGTPTDIPPWRLGLAAAGRDRCREELWDKRLQTEPARIMVLNALRHFAGNDYTHQEAFDAARAGLESLPEEERPSDQIVNEAESYFIQLMDKVSGSSDPSRP